MCGAGRAGHMCESGWSDGESFRTSREPLSSEVEHISMVTDHGELLFCCSPSLRARRRCASRLRGGISSANVTVAAQQTQQLCLIALAFKVKQTADLHFDHSGLIYEFISVVWQVKYYMCCNQSWLPLCLCTKIHLHFHLSRLKLIRCRQSKRNTSSAQRQTQTWFLSVYRWRMFPAPLQYFALLTLTCLPMPAEQ